MNIAVKYRDRIDESLFPPQVNWRNPRNDRKRLVAHALVRAVSATRADTR
jgi:hypothetical protein